MNVDWSHPVAAVVGIIVGAVVMWRRGNRSIQVDVTVRQPKEKEDDDE